MTIFRSRIRLSQEDGRLEKHRADFKLADIILGGQDGLVNVLGVILGVAAASGSSRLVVVAGLAATFAESISMAAVSYTSKKSSADFYDSELAREVDEIEELPEVEKEEVREIYRRRDFSGELLEKIVGKIVSNRRVWLEVMMAEELKLEKVDRSKILGASILVGSSAFFGSLIPLAPFVFLPVDRSVYLSLVISALTLFFLGVYKARTTVGKPLKSGLELAVIGLVSALAGYFVGLAFRVSGGI